MNDSHQVRGFTLIEVLVVASIIALLIAILMPALTAARNQAQAAVCSSNMKQGLQGVLLKKAETQMRKEQWSTNYGWAVESLRENKGQTKLFTCPSDPQPRPVPAVRVQQFDSDDVYHGTTTGDAIYNRVRREGATWQTDVQDRLEGDMFGGDAWKDDEGDLLFTYSATSVSQTETLATPSIGGASWSFNVETYQGKTIVLNAGRSGVGSYWTPLLWMSYGANASAGLKGVKGTPIVIVEAGKLGVFPEELGKYKADNLARVLRFRHGGRESRSELVGLNYVGTSFLGWPIPQNLGELRPEQIDPDYQPRSELNAGFIDGHVERLGWQSLFSLPGTLDIMPTIKQRYWLGIRREQKLSY